MPNEEVSENVVNATYVSVWEGEVQVCTSCKYNTKTKLCFDVSDSDTDVGDSMLVREYVELADGTELSDGVKYEYKDD